MELKLLHVHTQELGIDGKPSCLVSRSDVEDDVSEAVREKSQLGAPTFRAPPSLLCCSLGQYCLTESRVSPLLQCQAGPAHSSPSLTSAFLIFLSGFVLPSCSYLPAAGMCPLPSTLLEDAPSPHLPFSKFFLLSNPVPCSELHPSLVPPRRQEESDVLSPKDILRDREIFNFHQDALFQELGGCVVKRRLLLPLPRTPV